MTNMPEQTTDTTALYHRLVAEREASDQRRRDEIERLRKQLRELYPKSLLRKWVEEDARP